MAPSDKHPQNIGKYKISKVLGKGAMGTVYKGFDTVIERWVAIKMLHQHLLEDEGGEEFSIRFKQEAQAAARCLHPNIVTIFDFGIENETSYIVMEYVEGTELKEEMHHQRISTVVQAIKILLQILDGLEMAHSKGVIHRDIKPANIIMLADGRVKVSDFGVARLDTSDLTSAGFMVGTPNYMSPEGLRGEQVDHRSDLYSCALLLLEIITRSKPYAGRNTEELLAALELQTQIAQNLRYKLDQCIRKALSSDPGQRYQSAAKFRMALASLIDQFSEDEEDDQKTMIIAAPQRPSVTPPHSQASQSQMGAWNPDLLKAIEDSLIKYIGPMAKVLIRKNSKTAISVSALSQQLAEQIPSDKDRMAFLKNLSKSGVYSSAVSGLQQSNSLVSGVNPATNADASSLAAVVPASQITLNDLDKITKALLFHVGPLASRIVKHASKSCTDTDELILKVSAHIPDDKERSDFIQKLRNSST
jgi:serine/threonine protein kinase